MSGQFALAVLDGRLFAAGGNLADNSAVAHFVGESTAGSHVVEQQHRGRAD